MDYFKTRNSLSFALNQSNFMLDANLETICISVIPLVDAYNTKETKVKYVVLKLILGCVPKLLSRHL